MTTFPERDGREVRWREYSDCALHYNHKCTLFFRCGWEVRYLFVLISRTEMASIAIPASIFNYKTQ